MRNTIDKPRDKSMKNNNTLIKRSLNDNNLVTNIRLNLIQENLNTK